MGTFKHLEIRLIGATVIIMRANGMVRGTIINRDILDDDTIKYVISTDGIKKNDHREAKEVFDTPTQALDYFDLKFQKWEEAMKDTPMPNA